MSDTLVETTATLEAAPPRQWASERIYRPEWLAMTGGDRHTLPHLQNVWHDAGYLRSNYESVVFTNEFIAEFKRETSFALIEELNLTPVFDNASAIGRDKMACPVCNGSGTAKVRVSGYVTGLVLLGDQHCSCQIVRSFYYRAGEAMRRSKRFADANLSTLKPDITESILPLARQAAIITQIKGNSDHSYLFQGTPGTGKTHFAFALYKKALLEWALDKWAWDSYESTLYPEAVWRIPAPVLIEQHMAWDRRNLNDDDDPTPVPYLTERMIERSVEAGLRPRLFIDELDKIKPTDRQIAKLGKLIDMIYEAEGQIVATTNATVDQLARKWDGDMGAALSIIRRIGLGKNAQIIDFTV